MRRLALIALACFAATAAAQPDRKFFKTKVAVDRHIPISSGVVAGDTLYISGTTVSPPRLAAGLTPEQEARELMDEVKKVVEQAGMTMDDVVSIQVFCTDLSLYETFNAAYATYFHDNYPSRAFVGVSKLLFGARFEVNGIAVKKRNKS
jgi:enamine deaminase RidA (YjgF/YER057c/UK114 family)